MPNFRAKGLMLSQPGAQPQVGVNYNNKGLKACSIKGAETWSGPLALTPQPDQDLGLRPRLG